MSKKVIMLAVLALFLGCESSSPDQNKLMIDKHQKEVVSNRSIRSIPSLADSTNIKSEMSVEINRLVKLSDEERENIINEIEEMDRDPEALYSGSENIGENSRGGIEDYKKNVLKIVKDEIRSRAGEN